MHSYYLYIILSLFIDHLLCRMKEKVPANCNVLYKHSFWSCEHTLNCQGLKSPLLHLADIRTLQVFRARAVWAILCLASPHHPTTAAPTQLPRYAHCHIQLTSEVPHWRCQQMMHTEESRRVGRGRQKHKSQRASYPTFSTQNTKVRPSGVHLREGVFTLRQYTYIYTYLHK